MVQEKSWQEFRDSGVFWFMNNFLHAFGWAIVAEVDKETGEIIRAYPARVKFRGFDENSNTEGYKKVSAFLKENADQLEKEANE